MADFRKICPECNTYMFKKKHISGLWYYECPECGFTIFIFGVFYKAVALLLIVGGALVTIYL